MPFNQASNQVPPLLMVGQGPVRLPASNQGPAGPGPSKGDSHGPPNHHTGHSQEMRRDHSAERDPERGPPFRGSQDWGDHRDNRGSAERRGPPQDYHDRFEGPDQFHDDFRKDERFGHRPREFENRMGPNPHERVGEGVLVLSGIFLLIRSTGNLGTRSRGAQVGVHPKVGTEGKPRKSDSRGSLKKHVFVGGEMTGSGRFEGDLVTMDVAHGGEKLLSTWMTSWGTMSLTKQRRMQGVVIQQLEGVAVE